MTENEKQVRSDLFYMQADLNKGIKERIEYIAFLSENVKYLNSYSAETKIEFYKAFDKVPVILKEIEGLYKEERQESIEDLISINNWIRKIIKQLNGEEI